MKTFFWKDKSGRGFTNNNMTVEDLKNLENEEDWNGNELHEWAEDAEEGDEWEDSSDIFTCISSQVDF